MHHTVESKTEFKPIGHFNVEFFFEESVRFVQSKWEPSLKYTTDPFDSKGIRKIWNGLPFFYSISRHVGYKSTLESRKNKTMSATILFSADLSRADICGMSIKYITNELFFCSSSVKSEQTWLRPGELRFEGGK